MTITRRTDQRLMAARFFSPARRVAAIAASALALASIGACANAGPYNPDNLPADQVANVNSVCRSVMGLQPGSANYGGCIDSLMASARGVERGEALQSGRAACLNRGLRPGGAGFAVCELQSAHAGPVRATDADATVIAAAEEPGGARSYAYTSPGNVFRREQLSCARLGLDPADEAFASCVAGLQSALFAADNPSQ
jgi:hypothetical protein